MELLHRGNGEQHMTKTWKDSNGAGADDLLQCFREAASDDLGLIAALHDREIDAVAIAQLKSIDFPLGLGLKFRNAEARAHRAA